MAADSIHVVAAVIRDDGGRILLTQRPAGKHLAGLWEFPGGKCEPGERPHDALRRELREEIGIEASAFERLIAIPWRYPEKTILLDVYSVVEFAGAAHGRENQALQYVSPDAMSNIPMPPADRPVVNALRLPPNYVITPEVGSDPQRFLRSLERVLREGQRLVQLRSKELPIGELRNVAAQARRYVHALGGALLLNGDAGSVEQLELDGVHLTAHALMQLKRRPLEHSHWVAASCHDAHELEHAAAIDVDFAVVGSVLPSSSHPGVPSLGWDRFAQLCAAAPFPVYALGGMKHSDLASARESGAQGIAGISAFWPS